MLEVAVTFIITIALGVPVAICLGMAGVVFLVTTSGQSLSVLPTLVFGGIDSFPLMAIPFFIMAGDLMARCGVLPNLVALADSLVGHFRGGLAYVNIVASMFFSGVTGVAVADAAAIGSMLIPAMIKQGYSPRFCAALTAAASMMGPIIPPSVAMVIYANVFGGGISVAKLFLLGVVPGCLLGFGMMGLVFIYSRKRTLPVSNASGFSIRRVLGALYGAIPGLMVPLIILGGIIGGIFTPTEAGAVAVSYSVVVGILWKRTLSFKDLADSFVASCKVSSVVFLLLATAKVMSFILASQQIPQMIASTLLAHTKSGLVFIVFTVLFLIALGFVLEAVATMIMLVPVLAPAAISYGVEPHLFGLIVVMAVQVALITPPVALGLFITTPLAGCSMEETVRYIWPFIALAFGVMLAVASWPGMTSWVPRLFGL